MKYGRGCMEQQTARSSTVRCILCAGISAAECGLMLAWYVPRYSEDPDLDRGYPRLCWIAILGPALRP